MNRVDGSQGQPSSPASPNFASFANFASPNSLQISLSLDAESAGVMKCQSDWQVQSLEETVVEGRLLCEIVSSILLGEGFSSAPDPAH